MNLKIHKALLALIFSCSSVACSNADDTKGDTTSGPQESVAPDDDSVDWSSKKSTAEILAESADSDWRELPQDELLYIKLERGTVIVALSPSLAQNHVSQIKALTAEEFYDGLSFYRVIEGFVAQGGDAFGTREIKNAAEAMEAEFEETLLKSTGFTAIEDADGYADEVGFVGTLPAGIDVDAGSVWHLHCTGAFAFGRNNERDSASTEFYIALQPQRYLDRNLTVFGRVVQGMEHLQALRRVSPPESESDDRGETIISMRMGSQVGDADQVALEILDSITDTFNEFVEARRNRPEEFFYYRPNYADICQLPIPVREASRDETE